MDFNLLLVIILMARSNAFIASSCRSSCNRGRSAIFSSPPPQNPNFNITNVKTRLTAFKEIAFPYFTETDGGKKAFATVIVLTLLNSGVSVLFSYVGRDFYSALSSKDVEEFYTMLQKYAAALVTGVPVSVIYRFQKEKLSLEWRDWMTRRTLDLYYANKVFYKLERSKEIDNPDQRIAEVSFVPSPLALMKSSILALNPAK